MRYEDWNEAKNEEEKMERTSKSILKRIKIYLKSGNNKYTSRVLA